MLAAIHVRDESMAASLRRKAPVPGSVPGLLGSYKMVGAEFSGSKLPKPQPSRSIVMTWWEDADAYAAAVTDARGDGLHILMRLTRVLGAFPGLDRSYEQLVDVAAAAPAAPSDPIVSITIGTAYAKSVFPFLKLNNDLEAQFVAPGNGALWGTAMTAPPLGVATLSVWPDTETTMAYVRSGAHGAAMAEHYDATKDVGGHTYVTDGGFFGFVPVSITGSLGGRNPTPASFNSLVA